ncbi:MAG: hypothetical protein QW303_05135 [Nitrososphaerota archaeon]
MLVEIPPIWLIIGEIVVGAILSKVFEPITNALKWATVTGFLLGVYWYAFSDPTKLTQLSVATTNEMITVIIASMVSVALHITFFDVGTLLMEKIWPSN